MSVGCVQKNIVGTIVVTSILCVGYYMLCTTRCWSDSIVCHSRSSCMGIKMRLLATAYLLFAICSKGLARAVHRQ